jgi:hypothetical protein
MSFKIALPEVCFKPFMTLIREPGQGFNLEFSKEADRVFNDWTTLWCDEEIGFVEASSKVEQWLWNYCLLTDPMGVPLQSIQRDDTRSRSRAVGFKLEFKICESG